MSEGKKTNSLTKEQLNLRLARYFKQIEKESNNKSTSEIVNINHINHYDKETNRWISSEISFNDNSFYFYDYKITDNDFIDIIDKAIDEASCSCDFQTIGSIPDRRFHALLLLGKPCKEFTMLNRLLEKYCGDTLAEFEIMSSQHMKIENELIRDVKTTNYLCYDRELCTEAIKFVREYRTKRDVLKVSKTLIEPNLNNYPEDELKCADEAKNKVLTLLVATPKNKVKGELRLLLKPKELNC